MDSFFLQRARIDLGEKHHVCTRDQQVADIVPSSSLQQKPEWAIYHETVVPHYRRYIEVVHCMYQVIRMHATCGYQWYTWLLPG